MSTQAERTRRVLVTGISGTGKSSISRELTARGYRAVDADDGLSETASDGEGLERGAHR